jgi:hypothetical protein
MNTKHINTLRGQNVELLNVFREVNRYNELMQEKFAEKFPETPVPHRKAVCRLTEKFRGTGSVLDVERSGRPSKNLLCIVITHAYLMS